MGAVEDVHHRRITGSLAMFDRMIFKGHLMRLYGPGGVQAFLWAQGVPLTRFGAWAKTTTDALCLHAKRSAEEAGRPYIYLVGMASNHRYLDALAAAPLKGEGVAALDALCRSKTKDGRRHARFNLLSPADRALFRAVLAGGHAIAGFRNADLTARLYPRPPVDAQDAHRRCARVFRLIAKLRGHGLVARDPPRTSLPPHSPRLPGHVRCTRNARRPVPRPLPLGGLNPVNLSRASHKFRP